MNSQEKKEFEERLYEFYLKIIDHRINNHISPLSSETLEKFVQIKKKLWIKETL